MSELSEPCVPSCQVEIGGFTWTIYATTTKETIDKIELVTRALTKRGYSAPRRPAFGSSKPAPKPLAKPLIDGDGEPCCCYHTRHDGRPARLRWVAARGDLPGFWGCASKGQGIPGETINQNGYCNLRFDWPAESAPQNGKVTR
jgi:hypothetical protein